MKEYLTKIKWKVNGERLSKKMEMENYIDFDGSPIISTDIGCIKETQHPCCCLSEFFMEAKEAMQSIFAMA